MFNLKRKARSIIPMIRVLCFNFIFLDFCSATKGLLSSVSMHLLPAKAQTHATVN